MESPEVPLTPPDPYLARFAPEVLDGLCLLFTLGGMAARQFWRPDPRLDPLVAEVEAITGFTEDDIQRLSALADDRVALAHEAILRPAATHTFCALAMALSESALSESPLVPVTNALADGAVRRFAAAYFKRLEANEDTVLADFPLDYQLPAIPPTPPAAAEPPATHTAAEEEDEEEEEAEDEDEPSDLPDGTTFCTAADLRLRRLQLHGLLQQAETALRDVARSDTDLLSTTAPSTDEADTDPELHEYYHESCYRITGAPHLMELLVITCTITSFWYLDAGIPFARAASQMRWLRRRQAAEDLRDRLIAHDPEQDLPLSLAELLTLYQMMQALALAGLHDLIPVLERQRQREYAHRQRRKQQDAAAAAPADDAELATEDARNPQWLASFFEPDSPTGQGFYHAVSSFTNLVHTCLTSEDEKAELTQAQAEIAALAELVADQ